MRGARVLVTAPCCHKQVRKQVWPRSPPATHHPPPQPSTHHVPPTTRRPPPITRYHLFTLSHHVLEQLDPFLSAPPVKGGASVTDGKGKLEGSGEHAFEPVLRHAIFRERTAEMVTDAVRALLLELAGYDVKVISSNLIGFEFGSGGRWWHEMRMGSARMRMARDEDGIDLTFRWWHEMRMGST